MQPKGNVISFHVILSFTCLLRDIFDDFVNGISPMFLKSIAETLEVFPLEFREQRKASEKMFSGHLATAVWLTFQSANPWDSG